jgi:hypothetical protein
MENIENTELLEQALEEAMQAAEDKVASARDEIRHVASMMKEALDKNDEDAIMLLGILLLPLNNVYGQFMERYKQLQNE